MKYSIPMIFSGLILAGCNASDPEDSPDFTCQGFNSPSANIYVRDAMDGEVIDSATVVVNSIGETEVVANEATFIDGDDGLGNSEADAYYTGIGVNEANWLVNFSVSAPGYEDYNSEDYEFVLNTTCGAENNFVKEVSLCPVDETCE